MSGIRLDAIDEAALRLRNLGAWDNKLGDAFQILIKQVRTLEEFAGIHMAMDKKGLPSKIESWDDFEGRMAGLLKKYVDCNWVCHALPGDFIVLAQLSLKWREQGAAVPAVLRVMNFGTVSVEWEKPGCGLLLDSGHISSYGEEKDFRKHKLLKTEKTKTLFEPER